MGNYHLLSPVTGSEVIDSRPVGSGHWALKGPSDCAWDSDWKIPLILFLLYIYIYFFFFFNFGAQRQSYFIYGVPSLWCLETPRVC